tara:strand:- start:41 stop:1030 length:990 start_codon:yes stop_codon:yes gene_type:complete
MSEETGRMSEEDKFLGVKTTIEPPTETETTADVGEVNVSVVDDRSEEDQKHTGDDSELGSYSDNVQKRINKLRKDYHEERRAKEESSRLANEAVNYTQALQTENQRLVKLVQDSQTALTDQSRQRAGATLKIAQENFKRAHESGDASIIAQAQQDLTNAQLSQAYAPSVSQKIIDDWKRNVMAEEQVAQSQQQYIPPPVEEPDDRAVEWQEQNPWFGADKEMTSFAYGVHERLVRDEGIDPETEEYYELINKRMEQVFPAHFSGSDNGVIVETAPRRKASNVVAPASRNSGARSRKVTLTRTQVKLADRLGITPEQYAVQLMKERERMV